LRECKIRSLSRSVCLSGHLLLFGAQGERHLVFCTDPSTLAFIYKMAMRKLRIQLYSFHEMISFCEIAWCELRTLTKDQKQKITII